MFISFLVHNICFLLFQLYLCLCILTLGKICFVVATEEEAAEAYDIAAIKFRGINVVTNFEMNRYDVEVISSSSLPVGGSGKRLKISTEVEQKPSLISNHQIDSMY